MSTIVTFSLQDSASPFLQMRKFSVDDYHQMIRSGILAEDEPIELLDGLIVTKMPRNPVHDLVIERADAVLRRCTGSGWRMRIQSAITTNDSEPEPDIAIIRGVIPPQVQTHPSPDQVALIIEIAGSSLENDRVTKGQIYARARIPTYWIVNLADRLIEVYSNPTSSGNVAGYDSREVYGEDESIALVLDGQMLGHIAVRDILC